MLLKAGGRRPQHSPTKVRSTVSANNSRYNLSTLRTLNRVDVANIEFFDMVKEPKLFRYLPGSMQGTRVDRIVDEKFRPKRYNDFSIGSSTYRELPRVSLS